MTQNTHYHNYLECKNNNCYVCNLDCEQAYKKIKRSIKDRKLSKYHTMILKAQFPLSIINKTRNRIECKKFTKRKKNLKLIELLLESKEKADLKEQYSNPYYLIENPKFVNQNGKAKLKFEPTPINLSQTGADNFNKFLGKTLRY